MVSNQRGEDKEKKKKSTDTRWSKYESDFDVIIKWHQLRDLWRLLTSLKKGSLSILYFFKISLSLPSNSALSRRCYSSSASIFLRTRWMVSPELDMQYFLCARYRPSRQPRLYLSNCQNRTWRQFCGHWIEGQALRLESMIASLRYYSSSNTKGRDSVFLIEW